MKRLLEFLFGLLPASLRDAIGGALTQRDGDGS